MSSFPQHHNDDDDDGFHDVCRTCADGKFSFTRMTYDGLCVFCTLFLLKEKYSDPVIRKRLLIRVVTLPPQDIEFVMPQLSQMALTFPAEFSDAMGDVLVHLCANFMHLALKLTWWLEAAAFYLNDEAVKRAGLLNERIETAVVQGTPDVLIYTHLNQDGDDSGASSQEKEKDGEHNWKLDLLHKKSRSDFFTAHLQLLRILNSTSTQLTPLSRPKRKQLLPYCLAHIKANGLYFPVFDALNEHFIIHQIYSDQGIVLNSRDKAPFLLWAKVEFTDKALLDGGIYKPTALPLIEAHLRNEIEATIQQSSDNTVQNNDESNDDEEKDKNNSNVNLKVVSLRHGNSNNVSKDLIGYDPFGETVEQRSDRLLYDIETPETNENVSLLSVIFKGGDDCRQEVIAMQWISLFEQIFTNAQLPLQLRPYVVLVASHNSGMIETIVNSVSIDGLKKGLPPGLTFPQWFIQYFSALGMYQDAVQNFVESMAGYSLVCYFLQIKDRHNGNIMLDNLGRLMHIDFGFMLSSSPGGNMNFENVPFKLTQEYIQIMGGEDGAPFRTFQAHFVRGFLEVRKHYHKFIMLADIMQDANIVAFKIGGEKTIAAFKARFVPDLTEVQAVEFAVKLVTESCNHWRSSQYDEYQRFTNGIL